MPRKPRQCGGLRQYFPDVRASGEGAPFAVLGSLRAEFPALAGSALAAELAPPPPPVFTWTGICLAAQMGYAWGDNTGTVAFVTPGGLFGGSDLGRDARGVIGGGHLGYNLDRPVGDRQPPSGAEPGSGRFQL